MGEEVMMSDYGSLDSHDHDGSILINSVIKENENPNVEDDINNRLTVSRLVSDLVTRGMLNAVETEAAEKIAQKEIELSRLKEALLMYHVSSEKTEASHTRLILDKACKDEYEQRLLEQNVNSCCNKSLVLERTKEIAGLRRELELISKLLTGHESGDIEALEDQKRTDVLHRKISGSLGKHIGSFTSKTENLEELRQLSREQLINHFKTEMNQLKREHDYIIQEMTEEYFSIKRRYLNLEERGSFSSLKKDKEFDVLRKKIPDIISKLDNVLLEVEKSVFERKSYADYKSQLDSLLLENRQLKDSLSEADQKISQLSQVEENHRKLIELDVKDLHGEAPIYDDLYGSSSVGEFVNQIQCVKEETNLEHRIMRESYELISRDLVNREEEEASESKSDLEDSCVESYMAEEYCAVIYKEALKEADKKLGELNMNVSEKERALGSEMVEKEKLKEEIHWLECLVKEKENLVQIVENDLATEREKLEIVFQQMNYLQFQIDQQAVVIKEKNKELEVVSARALEITEGYEMEISELRQKLELARENMKITKNEKMKSELKLSSTVAEQERLQNQFVSTVLNLAKWSQSFETLECLVAEKTKKTNSRLISMQSQLSGLLDEVDELKARESMYKQQMEKKTCDLQKAESEVDLLGDEIESLLELLKKIYIALDHYSPILKHYPGIIEILKLVRRELRGESKRVSVF